MAIIKCPECGRQVSDLAPTCPNCGVEIAGKIVRCSNCGEIYFRRQPACPNCHCPNQGGVQAPAAPRSAQPGGPASAAGPSHGAAAAPQPKPGAGQSQPSAVLAPKASPTTPPAGQAPKKGKGAVVVAFLIAVVACGVFFHFYSEAKSNKEQQMYALAMRSTDPTVLQNFLDTYRGEAPEAHIDSIQAHLKVMAQDVQEWTNALMSGSRTQLLAYLDRHPDTSHRQEILIRVDSLDWLEAKRLNTIDGYQAYLESHSDGDHVDEATENVTKLKSREVQPEEKQSVVQLLRTFFQSINSRNEDRLLDKVEDVMSTMLGKNGALKSDVAEFLHRQYKEGVANLNWHLGDDFVIDKREIGDDTYEFDVEFTARQDVDHNDGSHTESRYKASVTVSPQMKISAFSLKKMVEE